MLTRLGGVTTTEHEAQLICREAVFIKVGDKLTSLCVLTEGATLTQIFNTYNNFVLISKYFHFNMKPPELAIKLCPLETQAVLLPSLEQSIGDDPFALVRSTSTMINKVAVKKHIFFI